MPVIQEYFAPGLNEMQVSRFKAHIEKKFFTIFLLLSFGSGQDPTFEETWISLT